MSNPSDKYAPTDDQRRRRAFHEDVQKNASSLREQLEDEFRRRNITFPLDPTHIYIIADFIAKRDEAHSLQEQNNTELHWMRNASRVLQFVIDADSGFMGDSKACAKHWKTKTDELIEDRIKQLEGEQEGSDGKT